VDARHVGCSTPEGVIVGFTERRRFAMEDWSDCSTPEGVIVGFTGSRS